MIPNNNPSLNQISFLQEQINKDEGLVKHFDLSESWEKLKNLTLSQYKYILYLMLNGKRMKLNQIMTDIGFIQKYEQSTK